MLLCLVFLVALGSPQAVQDPHAWNQQYRDRAAAARADQLESAAQPVFRYRAAIAGLLQVKPGMTVADIGAGSGFLARTIAQQVGAAGRVYAVEADPKMVAYIQDRARAEGLANITAVPSRETSVGLDVASVDAAAIVNTFSTWSKPREVLGSIAAAMKPGGVLVVVDLPREGQGASAVGIDADEVVAMAGAAGFDRVSESTVVPGQYAIRFRKR